MTRYSGGADPSLPVGLLRPIVPADIGLFNINGRIEFVQSLYYYWPELFESLWSATDGIEGEGALGATFGEWCLSRDVVDLWLQDACWELIMLRRSNGKVPFAYVPNEPVIPYFELAIKERPLFKKPVPIDSSLFMARFHDAMIPMKDRETGKEFEKRIMSQVRKELKPYLHLYHSRLAKKEQAGVHSSWAALMYSGKSASQVWKAWPGMDVKKRNGKFRYSDPERAIYRAVVRFAAEIGLTLNLDRNRLAA